MSGSTHGPKPSPEVATTVTGSRASGLRTKQQHRAWSEGPSVPGLPGLSNSRPHPLTLQVRSRGRELERGVLGQGRLAARVQRSDAGEVRLTERDLVTLRWVGEQYAVRLDQLSFLLGERAGGETAEQGRLSVRRTKRVVERWTRAGLASYRKILHGTPGWIWLTRKGLREVGLSVKYWEPSAGSLEHVFWSADVRRRVAREEPESEWVGERQLRAGPERLDRHHMPDAELTRGDSLIAIEVELTPKHLKRSKEIIAWHSHDYDGVWYFVSPTAQPTVRRALEGLPTANASSVRVDRLTP